MENIGIAFQLMVIGMVTVFLILLIVIYLGKLLIAAVNRYAPEEPSVKKKSVTGGTSAPVDALTREIIGQAVKAVTGGKGHVTEIVERG